MSPDPRCPLTPDVPDPRCPRMSPCGGCGSARGVFRVGCPHAEAVVQREAFFELRMDGMRGGAKPRRQQRSRLTDFSGRRACARGVAPSTRATGALPVPFLRLRPVNVPSAVYDAPGPPSRRRSAHSPSALAKPVAHMPSTPLVRATLPASDRLHAMVRRHSAPRISAPKPA